VTAGGIRHDLETIVDVASDDGQPVFTTPRPRGIDTSRDHRASTVVRRLQCADRLDPRRHAPEGPRREAADVATEHPVLDPDRAGLGVGRVVVHADAVRAGLVLGARHQVTPETVVAADLPGVVHALDLPARALAATFTFALTALTFALAAAIAGTQSAVFTADLETRASVGAGAGVVGVGVARLALSLALAAFAFALVALTLALALDAFHALLAQSASSHENERHRHHDHHAHHLVGPHLSTSYCLPLTDRNRALYLEPDAQMGCSGLDALPFPIVFHVTLELPSELVDDRELIGLEELSHESDAAADLAPTEVEVGVEVVRSSDEAEVRLEPPHPVVLTVELEPRSPDLVRRTVLHAHPQRPSLGHREVHAEQAADEVVALGTPEVLPDQVVGDFHLGQAVVSPAVLHVALLITVHVLTIIAGIALVRIPALDRRLGQAVFHESDDGTALPFLGSRDHRPLTDPVAVDTDLHQLVHHVARPRPRPNSPERILTTGRAHLCGAAERGHVLHSADFQASELSGIQSGLGPVEGVGPLRLPAHVHARQISVEHRPGLLRSILRVRHALIIIHVVEVVERAEVVEHEHENHHHLARHVVLAHRSLLLLFLSLFRVRSSLPEPEECIMKD